jgi:hypothetical protein
MIEVCLHGFIAGFCALSAPLIFGCVLVYSFLGFSFAIEFSIEMTAQRQATTSGRTMKCSVDAGSYWRITFSDVAVIGKADNCTTRKKLKV